MYATGLAVRHLQMSAVDYRGSEQYARAKRAQVTLNEMWAVRVAPSATVFHAMHPGWADTPGVEAALPTFRRITRPLLRTAEQGADTMVWLAADDSVARSSGGFWHDRRRRSIHKVPSTRRSDTHQRRVELWEWCIEQTGLEPTSLDPFGTERP
jgi:NAD(P)-dependent dehydrogenase (short-subunit alcohol dehydrogenase family)